MHQRGRGIRAIACDCARDFDSSGQDGRLSSVHELSPDRDRVAFVVNTMIDLDDDLPF